MREEDIVAVALEVATFAHKNQMYSDSEPYIEHPKRVAARVAHLGPVYEAAALLHDVLEDTRITKEMMRERGIPDEVLAIVNILTRQENEWYHRDYIVRVGLCPEARAIKLADVADNMAHLDNFDEEKAAGMLKRYTKAIGILIGAESNERNI